MARPGRLSLHVLFVHRVVRPTPSAPWPIREEPRASGVLSMGATRPGLRPDGPEDGGPSFDELMRRVRAGDEQAAADLVRRYEPAIRRAVRVRLRDPQLRRLLDSIDICQSVF